MDGNLFLVQHSDFNVSPAGYNHLAIDELLITKVFYTIQGEGPYAGIPAIFVRLAGCNRGDKQTMNCQFCDTDFQYLKGQRMKFASIEQEMLTAWGKATVGKLHGFIKPPDLPLVVITGGEPMLQNNLVGFLEYLGKERWQPIQIESNGDRLARGFLDSIWCETVDLVVSPKINRDHYYIKPEIIGRANALKFLVDHRPESPYHNVPELAMPKDPEAVFLSPITVYKKPVAGMADMWDGELIDHVETAKNYAWATKLAMRHGFRISIQQHLFLQAE